MKKDCDLWAKTCIPCQQSKVQRHVRAPIADISPPTQRFEHIHIDLILLPPSRGYSQCLTIVDRFTRFPMVIPIINQSAAAVAEALLHNWIILFGVPLRITSDQGPQFKAQIFQHLTRLLSVRHIMTTTYHPQSNGLVERMHRQLEAALRCHEDTWYEALPAVMFGMRAAIKADIGTSPTELLFGEPIRLPGEFISPTNTRLTAPQLVTALRDKMRNLSPEPMSRHGTRPTFMPQSLNTATHVFVSNDHVNSQYQNPYTGPYPVIQRGHKAFKIIYLGEETFISVDRLKPAFILPGEDVQVPVQLPPRHRPGQLRPPANNVQAAPPPTAEPQPSTSGGYARAYEDRRNNPQPRGRPRTVRFELPNTQ